MVRIIIKAVKTEIRRESIQSLQKNLPFAEWCWDKKKSHIDTFLRGLRRAGNDSCVQMEDDVILTKNFYSKLCAAIKERPDNVIQFFSMRKDDITIGSRWDNNFIANLCTYLPKGYAKMLADYWDVWEGKEEHPTGSDLMIKDWLKGRKEKYWIHIPNLVDHRVGKSLIDSRRSSQRVSKTFTKY